jgi:hypothetical protein
MGVCSVFTRACMHGGSYCGHRFVATQTDVLNVEEVQNPAKSLSLSVEAVGAVAMRISYTDSRQSEQRSGTVSDSGVARMRWGYTYAARMRCTNAMGVHLRCTNALHECDGGTLTLHDSRRCCASACRRYATGRQCGVCEFARIGVRGTFGQVIDNLNLDERATKEACALARNTYTRTRLLKDFYDGIHEIHRNSGTAKMQHAKMQQ